MIDFYDELDLDSTLPLDTLNKELSKRESIWKSRRTKAPDKAVKMLALIVDAREAFKTEAARAEYDRNLAESKKAPVQSDPNAERERQFRQAFRRALDFYANEQDDLAFEAAKQAQQYMTIDSPDGDLLSLLSELAYKKGDLKQAYSYINSAVMASPGNAYNYYWRATIFGEYFNSAIEQQGSLNAAKEYLDQNRKNYEKALELYKQGGDIEGQIECLKCLAESYSTMYYADFDRAETYAKQAISLGDTSSEPEELLRQIQRKRVDLKPYQGANHPSTSSGGGCYIATAVYGSYDCPQVWTLRRYRDYFLQESIAGRLFIRIYYAFSPVVVKHFGSSRWFIQICKYWLDKKVDQLHERGYRSDRYDD